MQRIYRKKKKWNFKSFLNNVNMAGGLILWALVGIGAMGFAVYETGEGGSLLYLFPTWLLFLSCVYGKRREKQQLEFYRQLEEFIGNLQMYFGYFQDMEEAVYEAAILSKRKVFSLGKWLQESLRSVQAGKEEIVFQADAQADEEQRAYVQLLVEIGKIGVKGEGDTLAMEETLRRLKEEIREKCREWEGIRDGFFGLLEICLLTVYGLPFARAWGSSNLEELKSWYGGSSAKVYLFLCVAFGIGLYLILAGLRFEGWPGFGRNVSGKAFLFGKQRETAEILRFYDWILLKKENPGSDLEEVLQGLIPLATVRREKVERLFYAYMQYGMEALEKAKEREESVAFSRILEGMLRCDQVAVKSAFASFEAERDYYLEQLREEQKKVVRESVVLGKVLAFLPLYVLILLMLILPFAAQGLAMLENYSRMFGA